jgi:hypothetical protein
MRDMKDLALGRLESLIWSGRIPSDQRHGYIGMILDCEGLTELGAAMREIRITAWKEEG